MCTRKGPRAAQNQYSESLYDFQGKAGNRKAFTNTTKKRFLCSFSSPPQSLFFLLSQSFVLPRRGILSGWFQQLKRWGSWGKRGGWEGAGEERSKGSSGKYSGPDITSWLQVEQWKIWLHPPSTWQLWKGKVKCENQPCRSTWGFHAGTSATVYRWQCVHVSVCMYLEWFWSDFISSVLCHKLTWLIHVSVYVYSIINAWRCSMFRTLNIQTCLITWV